VFVNVGIPGATVEQAIRDELPVALGTRPDLVTVWLNVNDLIHGITTHAYQDQLRTLLERVRENDATVLVANTPPLEHLPTFLACEPFVPGPEGACDASTTVPRDVLVGRVAAYNRAIETVALDTGAIVVDLHGLVMRARANGTEGSLVSGDGFHPSTEGHRAVAEAFAISLASVGTEG
jgi:lysophospholipase L1-like esterase